MNKVFYIYIYLNPKGTSGVINLTVFHGIFTSKEFPYSHTHSAETCCPCYLAMEITALRRRNSFIKRKGQGQIEKCCMYFFYSGFASLYVCLSMTPILWHFHLKTMSSTAKPHSTISLCIRVQGAKGRVLLSWLCSETLQYMTSAFRL